MLPLTQDPTKSPLLQPRVVFFDPVICNDLVVPNLDNEGEMALVNEIILDVGALETRIEQSLRRLGAGDGQSGNMRHKALTVFRDELLKATTRLRQEGLHPREQGSLW